MVKFEVFHTTSGVSASARANYWVSRHPNARILQMSHSQGPHADGSICIMYDEKTPAELAAEIARLSRQMSMEEAIFRALTTSQHKEGV